MAKKKNIDDSDMDATSDDTSDDTDISDLNINQQTSEKNTDNKNDKSDSPADFKLSCLHEWDENTLSSCIKDYLEMAKQLKKDAGPPFGGAHSSDFTPWWEEFTKLEHHKMSQQKHKDSDTYKSWFDKNSGHGSSWLSGPGPSSSSSLPVQKSEVEDIDVPSIYGNNPAPKGRRALKRERRAERAKTLGKKWFDMKAPDVDEKLKNDMELIKMRSILDPKRFYKHQDRKGLPKYFQMGTVVDEGTDFYSSRLTKKQRKQTLVEELMADANIRQYNKKKYAELQQKMRVKKKFKSKHQKA